MNPHDEANLAQIAWLRTDLPGAAPRERAVFGLMDGSTLTLTFAPWTWEPAGHDLIP